MKKAIILALMAIVAVSATAQKKPAKSHHLRKDTVTYTGIITGSVFSTVPDIPVPMYRDSINKYNDIYEYYLLYGGSQEQVHNSLKQKQVYESLMDSVDNYNNKSILKFKIRYMWNYNIDSLIKATVPSHNPR